ncbi:MAG: hypothetical protein QXF17_04320 [Ignisphaera sp.]
MYPTTSSLFTSQQQQQSSSSSLPSTIAITAYWEAIRIASGSRDQAYSVATIQESVRYYIPHMLLAINQYGRLTLTIQNNSATPITVEASAATFQDGLPTLAWLGTEPSGGGSGSSSTTPVVLSYAEKSITLNPITVSISSGHAGTISTRQLVLYNAVEKKVKDAVAIVKLVLYAEGGGGGGSRTKIGEATLKFVIVSVAEDEPHAIGGPYLPTNSLATHISIVEGPAAPWITNIYGALSTLLNNLSTNNILNWLTSQFDAQILGFIAVTSRNGNGERLAKLLVFLKETSPIAPIAVIIAALAGLALVVGLIFAVGYLVQVQSIASIAQPIAASIRSKDEMVNQVLNDPNLTADQKASLINAITNYDQKLKELVDSTTTLVRSTEPLPPIQGPALNLAPLLMIMLFMPLTSMLLSSIADIGGEE